MDDSMTWTLIHAERASLADALEELDAEQWATPSLCGGWTVREAAGHVVAGAEQTPGGFAKGMVTSGFRFNTMIDRAAHRAGELEPAEIVDRLRAASTSTTKPPAPVLTMLGEVVVHGEDIRQPLGLTGTPAPEAVTACLDMYSEANFPLGSKKRIAGLRLVATDVDWSHGDGPMIEGPGLALLLAITGRAPGLNALSGDGVATMRTRFAT